MLQSNLVGSAMLILRRGWGWKDCVLKSSKIILILMLNTMLMDFTMEEYISGLFLCISIVSQGVIIIWIFCIFKGKKWQQIMHYNSIQIFLWSDHCFFNVVPSSEETSFNHRLCFVYQSSYRDRFPSFY